jgi:CHRD domain
MRRSHVVVAAVLLLGSTLLATGIAHAGQTLSADLAGANEVPPGDPDGTGSATITINRGLSEICWSISVQGITLPATAAHIHLAPAGVAGPVVVPLSAPDATGESSGCTTVDRELAKAIAKDPSAYYVNVHNVDFPSGAARGQLG